MGVLQIPLTDAEAARVALVAQKSGVSVAEFTRRLVLLVAGEPNLRRSRGARTVQLNMRCEEGEAELLKGAARARRVSVSEFLRRCAVDEARADLPSPRDVAESFTPEVNDA